MIPEKAMALCERRFLRRALAVALLTVFLGMPGPAQSPALGREELNQDLDQFIAELEGRFAYLKANQADYMSAVREIRERGRNGMAAQDFAFELTKVLGLFKDCHAGIGGFSYPPGNLPFFIELVGRRYVAVLRDRTGFVQEGFPYIEKIDGRLIDDWLEAMSKYIAKGSSQLIRVRSLMLLERIQFARTVSGAKLGRTVSVDLAAKDGSARKTIVLEITDQAAEASIWPDGPSRMLAGNVGYLRLNTMLPDVFKDIKDWMTRFRGTSGLIVDVRDNRGGTRNVLRDLFPYFMTNSDGPRVANVSRYRLSKDTGAGYLDSRFMFPRDWTGWKPAEREAIEDFLKTFRPVWSVPEKEFSDWHFWLLSKSTNPDSYDYSNPVVFLMNQKCFSAADVVLSSVKGFRNVTLVGLPSGGGSGAATSSRLDNSRLSVALSSMASFQRDGRLFDGNGVAPDVLVEPDPEYFLQGGPDRMLDNALDIIAAFHKKGTLSNFP